MKIPKMAAITQKGKQAINIVETPFAVPISPYNDSKRRLEGERGKREKIQ